MLIKDLFNEIVRRLEWAKLRNLEPEVTQGPSSFVTRIPVDKSLAYVISINEIQGKGVLVKSSFPDGDPHHCIGIADVDQEQAASLINAAALIVYGRLIIRKEQ